MRVTFHNKIELYLVSLGTVLLLWSAIGFLGVNLGSSLSGWMVGIRTNQIGEGWVEVIMSITTVSFGTWLLFSVTQVRPVAYDPKCKDLTTYEMMVLAILRRSQRAIRADTLARVLHKARTPTEKELKSVEKALNHLEDKGLVKWNGSGRYVVSEVR